MRKCEPKEANRRVKGRLFLIPRDVREVRQLYTHRMFPETRATRDRTTIS